MMPSLGVALAGDEEVQFLGFQEHIFQMVIGVGTVAVEGAALGQVQGQLAQAVGSFCRYE